MILLLFIVPIMSALVLLVFRSPLLNRIVLILTALFQTIAALRLFFHHEILTAYFRADPLNSLLLLVTAFIFLAVTVYHSAYVRHFEISGLQQTFFSVLLIVFTVCLTGVLLSVHLGLQWVFLEATTLASAPLINFERSKHSLEATWKYLFLCSIGISLAFAGIVLLTFAANGISSLFFDDLNRSASVIKPFWLKLSFPFLALGFGTKAGLAPIHGWLPDAHSEAPAPISAMLSATLLNAALLGLIRISDITSAAGLDSFKNLVLLLMGFLSLFVCVVFILRSNHFKRMLAYSSIENIGIACIGLTLGTPGRIAAVIHLCSHSFAKTSMFLTSGNIALQTNTKEIGPVKGLLRNDIPTGWFWIIGFLALSGLPPFPAFFSELMIMKGLLMTSIPLFILFSFFLVLILYSMGQNVFQMSFGIPSRDSIPQCRSLSSYLPQSVLLLLLFTAGISLAGRLMNIFVRAAGV